MQRGVNINDPLLNSLNGENIATTNVCENFTLAVFPPLPTPHVVRLFGYYKTMLLMKINRKGQLDTPKL